MNRRILLPSLVVNLFFVGIAFSAGVRLVEVTERHGGDPFRFVLRAEQTSEDRIFGYHTCYIGPRFPKEWQGLSLDATRDAINADSYVRHVVTRGADEIVSKVKLSSVHLDTLTEPKIVPVLMAYYGDRGESLIEPCSYP